MKQITLLLISGLLSGALGSQLIAQEVTLPEVTVVTRNYKYLRAVDNKSVAEPVKLLERKAAAYDVKNSEFYEDDYDNYFVTFYLPEGYVLAVYDVNGKLLRTAEKFRDISLPMAVKKSIVKQYPNWGITKDVYEVKYDDENGANTLYKLQLQNGTKRIRVKVSNKGEILD